MKKILLALVLGLALVGCSSTQDAKTERSGTWNQYVPQGSSHEMKAHGFKLIMDNQLASTASTKANETGVGSVIGGVYKGGWTIGERTYEVYTKFDLRTHSTYGIGGVAQYPLDKVEVHNSEGVKIAHFEGNDSWNRMFDTPDIEGVSVYKKAWDTIDEFVEMEKVLNQSGNTFTVWLKGQPYKFTLENSKPTNWAIYDNRMGSKQTPWEMFPSEYKRRAR